MPRRPFLAVLVVLTGAATIAAVAAAPARPAAESQSFRIDPGHSTAHFRVHHLGAGMFWGRFDTVTGTIEIDESGAPSFDLTIPIESVHTGMGGLDDHLKRDDFFDMANHPAMTFRSTGARQAGVNLWEIRGDFTMRGVTKPIAAMVTFHGTTDLGRGARTGWEAELSVMRSQFGMDYGIENGALGDQTRIIVSLEGAVPRDDAS